MKIAVCLHGQPRNYKLGYSTINNFIKNNNNHTFDFFIHCWCDNNVYLDASPWRNIDKNDLYIENGEEIKKDIINLYNPCSYEFETPIKHFDLSNIENSIAYKNMNEMKKKNIHNHLSHTLSRNKVRNILHDYLNKVDTTYDMVLSTRMDSDNMENTFTLDNIDKNKTYVPAFHLPRFIISDFFILTPLEKYLNWFNFYENMPNIINNKNLETAMNNINEKLELNMEEYATANYLFYYDIKDLVYEKKIDYIFYKGNTS
jgi:hypothetical protein